MNLNDMTHEQIVALTQEDVERIAKIACMEKGVKLVSKPPPEPLAELYERDAEFFEIVGTKICTRTREAAEEIQRVLVKNYAQLTEEKYEWRIGSENTYLGTFDHQLEVKRGVAFSALKFQELQSVLGNKHEAREQYQNEKREFERSQEEYQKIAADIWRAYHYECKIARKCEGLKATFLEYVSLAGGDEEKAAQFFRKAYASSIENEADIVKKLPFWELGKPDEAASAEEDAA